MESKKPTIHRPEIDLVVEDSHEFDSSQAETDPGQPVVENTPEVPKVEEESKDDAEISIYKSKESENQSNSV